MTDERDPPGDRDDPDATRPPNLSTFRQTHPHPLGFIEKTDRANTPEPRLDHQAEVPRQVPEPEPPTPTDPSTAPAVHTLEHYLARRAQDSSHRFDELPKPIHGLDPAPSETPQLSEHALDWRAAATEAARELARETQQERPAQQHEIISDEDHAQSTREQTDGRREKSEKDYEAEVRREFRRDAWIASRRDRGGDDDGGRER
jgi:hypothetical protein